MWAELIEVELDENTITLNKVRIIDPNMPNARIEHVPLSLHLFGETDAFGVGLASVAVDIDDFATVSYPGHSFNVTAVSWADTSSW